MAIIFSCIDSRVPPELVFDRGLGDLFVVRTGAENHDALVQGSVEYGAVLDETALIVVLGHQRCGAVTAAVNSLEQNVAAPAHIENIVQSLRPAYLAAKQTQPQSADDLIEATIQAQIRLTVDTLRADPPLTARTDAGDLRIVGAYYTLGSGEVSWPGY